MGKEFPKKKDHGRSSHEHIGHHFPGAAECFECDENKGHNLAIDEVWAFMQDFLSGEEIHGALARGYCHPKNAAKVLDPDLIIAMAQEIRDLLTQKINKEI